MYSFVHVIERTVLSSTCAWRWTTRRSVECSICGSLQSSTCWSISDSIRSHWSLEAQRMWLWQSTCVLHLWRRRRPRPVPPAPVPQAPTAGHPPPLRQERYSITNPHHMLVPSLVSALLSDKISIVETHISPNSKYVVYHNLLNVCSFEKVSNHWQILINHFIPCHFEDCWT